MKRHLPNLITLLNLVSGGAALYMVLDNKPALALAFLLASVVFDFLDGLVARLLKATSEIGKQLDSLSDLVSFGLVPSAMIFMVMKMVIAPGDPDLIGDIPLVYKAMYFSVLFVPVFAALRLARFNLEPSTDFFIGLPTPAFALFWTGIYYDYMFNQAIFGQTINAWFLWGVMILMSFMMIVPVPMLTLKFKDFKILPNFTRYLLIATSAVIIAFTGIAGLPLVVLTYILLSLLKIVLT